MRASAGYSSKPDLFPGPAGGCTCLDSRSPSPSSAGVAALHGPGPGDPVVGTIVAVDRNVVGIRWTGTAADPYHRDEGAQLGGFTLFASMSPGGPVIAPPDDGVAAAAGGREGAVTGNPGFGIFGVPDGRYYVLPVRDIVQTPNAADPSAWSEVLVNITTCNAPPPAPVNLNVQGPLPPNGTVYAHSGGRMARAAARRSAVTSSPGPAPARRMPRPSRSPDGTSRPSRRPAVLRPGPRLQQRRPQRTVQRGDCVEQRRAVHQPRRSRRGSTHQWSATR